MLHKFCISLVLILTILKLLLRIHIIKILISVSSCALRRRMLLLYSTRNKSICWMVLLIINVSLLSEWGIILIFWDETLISITMSWWHAILMSRCHTMCLGSQRLAIRLLNQFRNHFGTLHSHWWIHFLHRQNLSSLSHWLLLSLLSFHIFILLLGLRIVFVSDSSNSFFNSLFLLLSDLLLLLLLLLLLSKIVKL